MKNKKFLLFLFSILLCYYNLSAQQDNFDLTNWEIITSYSDIREFSKDNNGKIWCATNGGIIIFDESKPDNQIEYIGSKEGIISPDIRKIIYLQNKELILTGSSDGMLQIIDKNKNIEAFNDIKNYGFINPEITDIEVKDNLIYISGGFGITIFDLNNKIFTETITKIANFNRNTKVNNININDNIIYASTEDGLAYATTNKLLANPENWQNIPFKSDTTQAIPSFKYRAINTVKFNNEIYAIINNNQIAKMNANLNDTLFLVQTHESYQYFTDFFVVNNRLYFKDQFNLIEPTLGGLFTNIPEYLYKLGILNNVIILQETPQLKALLSFKEEGFYIYTPDTLKAITLESPNTSKYKSSSVDINGNLWLATAAYLASDRSGKGISVLKSNGKWLNYNIQSRNEITTNSFINITPLPDGRVFSGTWGGGLYEFIPENENFKINKYDTLNSPFNGVSPIDNYVVVGKPQIDKNGDLWSINTLSIAGKNLLIKLDKSGNFHGFDYPTSFSSRTMVYLVIDDANTKWFANPEPDGLYYYNESNNVYGQINSSTLNFLSSSINSLKIDNRNWIWVGTPLGLNVILNPTSVLSNNKLSIRKINFLNNVVINDIYVDAVDNKWISTNQGIYVINPDGSDILNHFDSKNSPLKSDIVHSVTSNNKTGKIYIVSEDAIYTASSLSVQPNEVYDIISYPQPFDPDRDLYMTIEGLAKDNFIKILTPDGKYIRTIEAVGGRAIWDGKDDNGKIINNGIYMIIASQSDGEQTSVSKIAVEKK